MSSITGENLGLLSVAGKTSQVQKVSSFYGRLVSTISKGGSYITQSIKSIAQSILSKCVQIGSLGRYTLEDLKSCLFTKQGSLENKLSNGNSGIPLPPPLPSVAVTRATSPSFESIRMSVPPPPPPIESIAGRTNGLRNNIGRESDIVGDSVEKEAQIEPKTNPFLVASSVSVSEEVTVSTTNSTTRGEPTKEIQQNSGKKLNFKEELKNVVSKMKKKSTERKID
jgi:hypothetical protein